jgi:hypothetical protein
MHLVWVHSDVCDETRPLRSPLTTHIQRLGAIACIPLLQRGARVTTAQTRQGLYGLTFCPRGELLLRLGMPSRYPSLEVWASLRTFVCPPAHSIAAGPKPVRDSVQLTIAVVSEGGAPRCCPAGILSFKEASSPIPRCAVLHPAPRRVSAPESQRFALEKVAPSALCRGSRSRWGGEPSGIGLP